MIPTDSLADLVRGARQGQPEALEALVRGFAASARRLARALLSSDSLADDAVQDAFVTAFTRLRSLREPEAFPAWFRQVVRTAASRTARRRGERPLAPGEEAPDGGAGPAEAAEARERTEAVRAAIARLPPAGRQSVELFYVQERSVADVARMLAVPPVTVRRRLFDARARLARLLIGNPAAWQPVEKERTS